MNSGHDSRAVANEILRIGASKRVTMSMMKLIKLVYFSHGWCLGLTKKPLCSDTPEAWQYGPVFRTLYYSLPYSGSQTVDRLITDPFGNTIEPQIPFSDDEKAIMSRIVDVYGKLGAFQLSEITHESGSPWDKARKQGHFAPIDNAEVASYFASQRSKKYG